MNNFVKVGLTTGVVLSAIMPMEECMRKQKI